MAIERPKLRAMRSILSMPLVDFLVGNRVKISKYPGMKRIKGKPKIIRRVLSRLKRAIGISIRLQSTQMSIS